MNETFAKVLQFTVLFWIVLSGLAMIFNNRIGTYFLTDNAVEGMKDATSLGVLWNIMSFKITTQVPIWISIVLDSLVILTVISVIMAFYKT